MQTQEEIAGGEEPYIVLVNSEGQYSLWRRGMKIPDGWEAAGKEGSMDECSEFVDRTWTDMRPMSLRNRAR